jgi:hypothetical protein
LLTASRYWAVTVPPCTCFEHNANLLKSLLLFELGLCLLIHVLLFVPYVSSLLEFGFVLVFSRVVIHCIGEDQSCKMTYAAKLWDVINANGKKKKMLSRAVVGSRLQ